MLLYGAMAKRPSDEQFHSYRVIASDGRPEIRIVSKVYLNTVTGGTVPGGVKIFAREDWVRTKSHWSTQELVPAKDVPEVVLEAAAAQLRDLLDAEIPEYPPARSFSDAMEWMREEWAEVRDSMTRSDPLALADEALDMLGIACVCAFIADAATGNAGLEFWLQKQERRHGQDTLARQVRYVIESLGSGANAASRAADLFNMVEGHRAKKAERLMAEESGDHEDGSS